MNAEHAALHAVLNHLIRQQFGFTFQRVIFLIDMNIQRFASFLASCKITSRCFSGEAGRARASRRSNQPACRP
ncbi:MAG: hypothetical protein LRZ85_05825, partial [Alphaproteobacteria bacterium]|nr:hypothetical protein [Alphaproteobacteria bacterium]